MDLFSAFWKNPGSHCPTCVVRARSSGPFANVGSRFTGVKPSTTTSQRDTSVRPEICCCNCFLVDRTVRHGAWDRTRFSIWRFSTRSGSNAPLPLLPPTSRSGSNASTSQRWNDGSCSQWYSFIVRLRRDPDYLHNRKLTTFSDNTHW